MDTEVEINALRLRFAQDDLYLPVTQKQAQYLASLMHSKKPERIYLLRKITGNPVSSTKELTRWTASVLIDYLTTKEGQKFLNEIREEETPSAKQGITEAAG
jgi:hypothetical protein